MAPRNAAQNQQIRDERREQLLNAALRVFARRGLAATKISDIAKTAGLSHGLVYHYFDSKDEIFTELVERALDSSMLLSRVAARMKGDPWEKLVWLTEKILASAEGEAGYYFLVMVQALTSESVPPEAKAQVEDKFPANLAQLVPILVAGQAAGLVVQDDPERLAAAYFSCLQGVILMQIGRGEGGVQMDADLILRLLKA